MTKNHLKSAFDYYLDALLLPERKIYLYDEDAPVSVHIRLDVAEVPRLLRTQLRFDLASKWESAQVLEASVVIRHKGNSLFTALDFYADPLPGKACDAILEQFVEMHRAPLGVMAGIVEALTVAVEGPIPVTVWEFVTPGGFTVRVKASPDADIHVESLIDSSEPALNWEAMLELVRDPLQLFQLECEVEDPIGDTIGTAYLGRCSLEAGLDEQQFIQSVRMQYVRDLVTEAIAEARKHHPFGGAESAATQEAACLIPQ